MNTLYKGLYRSWEMLHIVAKRFVADQCSRAAAALSYTTLLAIVPLMLVGISIVSKLPSVMHEATALQDFVIKNFSAGSSTVLTTHLDTFLQQVHKLSWTNIIAFSVTALLLAYNMVHAFNMIWGVRLHKRFALSFILYFVVLLLAPLLFGTLMLLVSYVGSMSYFTGEGFHHFVARPFIFLSPYIAAFFVFSFFNWALPSCKVKIRYALVGGLITACLFELIKYFFMLYVQLFPTYRMIYGTLATIPIFFVWVYLSWIMILVGALFCEALQNKRF